MLQGWTISMGDCRGHSTAEALLVMLLVMAVTILSIQYLRPGPNTQRGVVVCITEIMAENNSTLADENGDFSDWIELCNLGDQTVNLEGWFLTDDFVQLKRWQIPSVDLVPGEFIVIFASGKNRAFSHGELHTNFSLSNKGEYLALVNPDGQTIAQHYLPKFPKQKVDVSYGIDQSWESEPLPTGPSWRRHQTFFHSPTPGKRNHDRLQGEITEVKIDVHRGIFTTPFEVNLSCPTPDVQIRYTLDGSMPTETRGKVYSEPIPISVTTILKFNVFRSGFLSPGSQTHTFLFPDSVLSQNGNHFPDHWGVRNGALVQTHYGLSKAYFENVDSEIQLRESLESLPSLSIVMDAADLFDAQVGIYSNPLETGIEWERPASIEWIHSGGHRGFQSDCGIRIQGGWSRRPEESPKHSFRLVFKKRYGDPSLEARVFPDAKVAVFETLVLRAGTNNSWLHPSHEERSQAQYLRDQWMRDTLRDMGYASPHGRFVHLYLNGLYWGLYNPCERPDASFAASYLGGSPEDYDALNSGKIINGYRSAWAEMMDVANAGLTDSDAYHAFRRLLDFPAFIDYMIVNYFGGNSDWDAISNWYAVNPRHSKGGFKFFIWDAERTLEKVDVNVLDMNHDQSPTRLFHQLIANPEFRRQFADHVQRHFKKGGALSPESNIGRWRYRSERIESAVFAEAARWGDYRKNIHSYKEGPFERYTVTDHWSVENQRIMEEYFPNRTETVLKQFQVAGFFPEIPPLGSN